MKQSLFFICALASRLHELRIHQPENEGWRDVNVSEMTRPLQCHNVLLHAVHSVGREARVDEVLIRRQLEWLPPGDCYVSHSSVGDPRMPHTESPFHDDPRAKEFERDARKRAARYEALECLTRLSSVGLLSTPGSDRAEPPTGVPWILLTDFDVVPLNKERTIRHLIDKLHNGLSLYSDTTETRLCSQYNACDPNALTSQDIAFVDRIALVLTPDLECGSKGTFSSAAMMTRPSLLLGFLAEAQLLAVHNSRYATLSDSEILSLVLKDLLSLFGNFLEHLCKFGDNLAWGPSTPSLDESNDGSEILLLRKFDAGAAQNHTVFGNIAKDWFPYGYIPAMQPDTIAVVNPRWMNSCGCRRSHRPEKFRWFAECGDMLAHFYGCHHYGYQSKHFRRQASASEQCVNLLPFKTNDENTGPFNATTWIGPD
eukprot:Protomagalhaensia_wolfi_Nauph_80__1114@NODE_1652_length_1418_cov_42_319797_g1281_i0_p1_GENE_NODE_1652_length_1418_cov_42_319797_g1281_i0NODE_1652_length_1418_cov_42_319797_g1281_i0_p1_ORF_typecomplete_len427_score39_39_NODE_1652_length_1418_cov_42_319797_g1281_i01061386